MDGAQETAVGLGKLALEDGKMNSRKDTVEESRSEANQRAYRWRLELRSFLGGGSKMLSFVCFC